MESFNISLKKEVCSLIPKTQEQALACLSAIIKSVGELSKNKLGEYIVIRTEMLEVFQFINALTEKIYGKSSIMEISDDTGFNDRIKYEVMLPQNLTTQILLDTETAFYDENKFLCFYNGISKYIIQTQEQSVEYIKGVYVACGTSNIVLSDKNMLGKKNTGYQMEFVFSSEKLSQDFSVLLAENNIITKQLKRKDFYVVYVQDFEQITSLIGVIGATKAFMALQNENAVRQMRNNVNRQNNCYSGNITKVVNASVEQLNYIKIIQDNIGIESLDESLRNVCYLRLANPDESLDNLVKLSTENLTKSGLYHRFKKLEKIAKEIS